MAQGPPKVAEPVTETGSVNTKATVAEGKILGKTLPRTQTKTRDPIRDTPSKGPSGGGKYNKDRKRTADKVKKGAKGPEVGTKNGTGSRT